MKKILDRYASLFTYLLPSPFSIALLLTFFTFLIAFFFTGNEKSASVPYALEILEYWQVGLWNNALMVFAMQMMLMLVLGHVLALTPLFNRFIQVILQYCKGTPKAALVVTLATLLVSLINWGLGLIFGAILARKVGEYNSKLNINLNYPLVGAAGYSGLMIWHGGFSGSSLVKIAEPGHISSIMADITTTKQLPSVIEIGDTVLSGMNILTSILLLVLLPLTLYWVGKSAEPTNHVPTTFKIDDEVSKKELKGMERFDYSKWVSRGIGTFILLFLVYNTVQNSSSSLNFITPNFINLTLLSLGLMFHKNLSNFLSAINKAMGGAAGILIQFPLYFGIMGMMKDSGMLDQISAFFISNSTSTTFPLLSFLSAGIVNVFVPSGGGQWAIQGPIIIKSALELGIPLNKCILAFAYGDQLTNMLQPFWALPLLGITGLKAREILPYTLILMIVGAIIFSTIILLN